VSCNTRRPWIIWPKSYTRVIAVLVRPSPPLHLRKSRHPPASINASHTYCVVPLSSTLISLYSSCLSCAHTAPPPSLSCHEITGSSSVSVSVLCFCLSFFAPLSLSVYVCLLFCFALFCFVSFVLCLNVFSVQTRLLTSAWRMACVCVCVWGSTCVSLMLIGLIDYLIGTKHIHTSECFRGGKTDWRHTTPPPTKRREETQWLTPC
jgi:hypothetical protein